MDNKDFNQNDFEPNKPNKTKQTVGALLLSFALAILTVIVINL